MKITNQFKSRLKTYFIKRLGAFEYRRGWMKLPVCPYCHRELKMGVNLSMYRTNCFRCNEHPNPSQLVMDIEGFDTYHELINFLNSGKFDELEFHEEKVELAEAKPLYLPEGFRILNIGQSQVAKALEDMSKAVALSSLSCLSMELAMRRKGLTLGTLLYPSITEDNLDIITREMLSGKVLGITTLTKISQELAKNLSYLIMMRWRCIGRYTSVKVHSMPLLLGIEELPQWVKLYLDIKSMNYLNPHAKDSLYCWTQTPRNMQSILRSNLLPIKKSRWCFYQKEKM